ncbi:MAG: IS630 family transposase [Thermodesulfobacteriota bacterium]|nr:IS630 family transposase [Thermodesulfobacteriota bacterium]
MRKTDGRKINPTAMEEIRLRAVQRVQAGESPEVVIKTLGFVRACIYNWLARYRTGGWHGLRTGQRSGRPKKLTASQIKWVYKTVRDKDPQQFKFKFALWTRSMIAALIKRQFGIRFSSTSVGRLLRQLGFSCQKPLYRACQRDSELVKQWKEQVFHRSKNALKKKERLFIFKMNPESDRIFIPEPPGL